MIKVLKKPKLKRPIFISAWSGMGSVSLKAATYLKDKLKAQEFAVIEPGEFFSPQDVLIEESLVKLPKLPRGRFYFWENKQGKNDIIIFISEAQPLQEKSLEYAKQIISFISSFMIELIITFAAMPLPIDHHQQPGVWGAGTHKGLTERLNNLKIKTLANGHISGLNGLFLGLAKKLGFSGICLLGEIPLYTIQIENPKASLAVLATMTKLLGISLDFAELRLSCKIVESEIERLIDYLKTPAEEHAKPISEDEIDKIKNMLSAQHKIPGSAKNKIELLFEQARKDIAQASALKKELDEWNVYKEYEDRFLDLFKKKVRKEN